MRFFLALVLILQAATSFGVDFTKLSRDEPVSTVYPSNFKCYVDVSLFLNATQAYNGPVYLRVSYIIGNDTLNDNLKIEGSFNGVIKQLFLDEGEHLTASIKLSNGETEMINGLEGSLRIVRNPEFEPSAAQGQNVFLSGVWAASQTPLFRIPITDSIPQMFRAKFTLNEHFEFDKLFFKVKVISPAAGILMLKKEVVVNEEPALELRKKTFSVDFPEVDLSSPGTYYFQVMHNMSGTRINGIDKINYEIVPE
ncbi:MAG: hypothetical protein EP314_06195 [Bacteroidetes bacterium]|nr:MAG: hypothetical protein EP314_06195 [Bacteroidota bacterium]